MEIAAASRWMAAGHACSRRPVRKRASGGAVDHVIGGHDRLYPRYSLQPQELSAGQAAAGRSWRNLGRSAGAIAFFRGRMDTGQTRSEEHTSELQSLMRISYAVFCLKKKKNHTTQQHDKNTSENL